MLSVFVDDQDLVYPCDLPLQTKQPLLIAEKPLQQFMDKGSGRDRTRPIVLSDRPRDRIPRAMCIFARFRCCRLRSQVFAAGRVLGTGEFQDEVLL